MKKSENPNLVSVVSSGCQKTHLVFVEDDPMSHCTPIRWLNMWSSGVVRSVEPDAEKQEK